MPNSIEKVLTLAQSFNVRFHFVQTPKSMVSPILSTKYSHIHSEYEDMWAMKKKRTERNFSEPQRLFPSDIQIL